MRDRWKCQVGLSDHTLDSTASIASIALGASIIEKHIISSRSDGGPDSAFSSEPEELTVLINQINAAWQSMGEIRFGPSEREKSSIAFRRSLRTTRDLEVGEIIDEASVRSMRPAGGLAPVHFAEVVGRRVLKKLDVGAPITWDVLEEVIDSSIQFGGFKP